MRDPRRTLSLRVSHRTVLVPQLWNIIYNYLLKLPVLEEAPMVSYAHDITLVVVAKYLEDAEMPL